MSLLIKNSVHQRSQKMVFRMAKEIDCALSLLKNMGAQLVKESLKNLLIMQVDGTNWTATVF